MPHRQEDRIDIKDVRGFWERHPAGYDEIKHLEDKPEEFLEERDRRTGRVSPKLREKYRMHLVSGLRVLDVGCGQGYNAQELVRSGASVTAVDLTSKGLSLAQYRFKASNMKVDFVQANMESLPFKDEAFDFIHSSGAIHHIPDIEQAVSEIRRVLRRGGGGSIMIYHKNSLTFWWNIMVKLRFKMYTLHLLPTTTTKSLLKRKPDLRAYVCKSWPSTKDIINAGTDFGGMENPLSRVFSKRDAGRLFRDFAIDGFATSWGAYKPFKEKLNLIDKGMAFIHEFIAERWGWYLFVYIRKRQSA